MPKTMEKATQNAEVQCDERGPRHSHFKTADLEFCLRRLLGVR